MKGCFVYFFYDQNNTLLYIGKTTNLRNRFEQHFSKQIVDAEPWKKNVDSKKIILLSCITECDLDIYETYFINKYIPLYNKDKIFSSSLSFELPYLEPTTYQDFINRKIDKTKNLLEISNNLPTNTTQLSSFISDIKIGGQSNYLMLINNQLSFNEEQLNKEWLKVILLEK